MGPQKFSMYSLFPNRKIYHVYAIRNPAQCQGSSYTEVILCIVIIKNTNIGASMDHLKCVEMTHKFCQSINLWIRSINQCTHASANQGGIRIFTLHVHLVIVSNLLATLKLLLIESLFSFNLCFLNVRLYSHKQNKCRQNKRRH